MMRAKRQKAGTEGRKPAGGEVGGMVRMGGGASQLAVAMIPCIGSRIILDATHPPSAEPSPTAQLPPFQELPPR